MSNIQIFNYQSNEVRTAEMGGEPWFVLKDVCNILGVVNDRNVAARLDEDEKGVCQMDTLGGTEKEQMWWAEERKRKKEAAKK